MSRIQQVFAELKRRSEAALIPFITAGDPDLATTLRIMRALEASGADCIELGIPFSDPSADGTDDSTFFRACVKTSDSINRGVSARCASFAGVRNSQWFCSATSIHFFALVWKKFARAASAAGA
jgi:tryptophan synthase alpha chain